MLRKKFAVTACRRIRCSQRTHWRGNRKSSHIALATLEQREFCVFNIFLFSSASWCRHRYRSPSVRSGTRHHAG